MRRSLLASLLIIGFWLFYIIGYGMCVYKAFTCNWEPIGKAEVVYTVGACSGLGGFIGYINVEDK